MPASPARRPREWARVKDKTTGHHYSVPAASVDEERHQVLKQDAVNAYGAPLPAKHATTPTTSTADSGEKKEGRGAAKNEGEGK